MYNILVIGSLRERALDLLERSSDIAYEVVQQTDEEFLIGKVHGIDGMTVGDIEISARLIRSARKLKVISRHGVGYDKVCLKQCNRQKISVAITGTANSVGVAEHTFYLMLAAARRGIIKDAMVRNNRFGDRFNELGVDLYGKTLLVVGYGRIGSEVAKRARAFGMRVLVLDPNINNSEIPGVSFVDTLDEGLELADIVTLHVPLTRETKNLIGARELRLLHDRAILINTCRGGVVDEHALASAITSGSLHAAGLDVFEQEPPEVNSPLFHHKRIVLSPHASSFTHDTLEAMAIKTVENVIDGVRGTLQPSLVVNPEVLDN